MCNSGQFRRSLCGFGGDGDGARSGSARPAMVPPCASVAVLELQTSGFAIPDGTGMS